MTPRPFPNMQKAQGSETPRGWQRGCRDPLRDMVGRGGSPESDGGQALTEMALAEAEGPKDPIHLQTQHSGQG